MIKATFNVNYGIKHFYVGELALDGCITHTSHYILSKDSKKAFLKQCWSLISFHLEWADHAQLAIWNVNKVRSTTPLLMVSTYHTLDEWITKLLRIHPLDINDTYLVMTIEFLDE